MTSTTNDILLQRVEKSGGATITFHINNIISINIEVGVPIFRVSIPQEDGGADSAIVEKIDGNTETITVSWILRDEPASMVEESGGILRIPETVGTLTTIDTADNQLKCLEEYFQSKTLDYYYKCFIRDENGNNILEKAGEMSDITFSKDISTPVTWTATAKFFVGTTAPATG